MSSEILRYNTRMSEIGVDNDAWLDGNYVNDGSGFPGRNPKEVFNNG